jgi:hypothetical protein
MRFAAVVVLAASLITPVLFDQTASLAANPQTFEVKGKITDQMGAFVRGARVTFHGDHLNKIVATNDVGVYETDLPLGVYTMTAERNGFRTYRRPLFRVTAPTSLTLDVILTLPVITDSFAVSSPKGAADCSNGDPSLDLGAIFLDSIRSKDGTPFQLYIRYTSATVINGSCIYTGRTSPYEDTVFVAYNLFSLQANRVVYNAKLRTIEATGNVVAVNELGVKQRSETMTLKIEDGKAVPIP